MSSATRSSSRRPQRNRKPVESIYTQAERELRESVGSSNTNRSSTGSITTSNSRRSPSRNQSDGNRSRRNVVSRSRASRYVSVVIYVFSLEFFRISHSSFRFFELSDPPKNQKAGNVESYLRKTAYSVMTMNSKVKWKNKSSPMLLKKMKK